ncbi:uncharacterized protein LOC111618667 isoform X1 [Centruroides sculpturatus]|uniref:uncharacterized protein LOC111618667 isoform X1 n=1 Tax=Centruroides sculpturatus TaxID=218467 RepID=UPI000C6DA40C|nr:uncharacterized protein LOC111618667 isoform X1 [Centruroides sculpturatus]
MSHFIGDNGQDIINILVRCRDVFVDRIASLWIWICESFNLFALYTSRDLWDKFHLWLCYIKSRLILDRREKQKLLEWVKDNVASNRRPSNTFRRFSECFYENPADFSNFWRDGILLCALVEALVPGSCPRYDLLNPEHKWDNARLALKLVEKKIGIKPEVTTEEIIKCNPKNEKKVACLLAQIKVASSKLKVRPTINRPDEEDDDNVVFDIEQECLARGMGLSVAVIGRQARFNIFLKSISNLNIVIEIKGKTGSLCSERITNRSPKRKNSVELEKIERRKNLQRHIRNIPFEYEVLPGKIIVGYTPVETGQHRLSIIWQGQHIMGSPYTVNVDDTLRHDNSESSKKSKTFLRVENSYRNDTKPKESSQGDVEKILKSKLGSVTKKRVLRHIMVVNGKEVVVEADSNDVVSVLGKLTKETATDNENSENTTNKLTQECSSKGSEFMAHYPSPSKNKMVSTPPSLTTVLEGIDQTDSDLLLHNLKSRKSSKPLNSPSLDKKERNLLDSSISKNENILKIDEDLTTLEKEEETTLQEDGIHHLDDDNSQINTDLFLNCLSEVSSRISTLSDGVNSDHESDSKMDLIKFDASPLKIENSREHISEIFEEQSKKLQESYKASPKTNSKFIEDENFERTEEKLHVEGEDNKLFIKNLDENRTQNEEVIVNREVQQCQKEGEEENEFYCLPIINECKENTFLEKHNSKVSTIDFQNDFRTEENTTKFVSVNPSTTIRDCVENDPHPIRKINYQKLFKSTKLEGSLVKNKVQEWERAMNKASNNETKEILVEEMTRPDSPILVSVRTRKQFWENGGHISEVDHTPGTDCDVEDRDVIRRIPDRSASVGAIYPFRLSKISLDKSTQVDFEDFTKTNVLGRKNGSVNETPDSEDSGICEFHRSVRANHQKYSPSACRHRHFNCNRNHLSPKQESICSDLTDATSINTDCDRGFIDDEIPDYANLLLDNYVSFTGLLDTERPISRRELLKHDFYDVEEEFLKEPSTPRAERCRIFGTGVYYGQVCLRNHFQVRTKGAGPGYLTVNIQGAGKHDVTEVTIIYSGNELYDILYEVSQPGYYIISIKWGDLNIPESPYICKITY